VPMCLSSPRTRGTTTRGQRKSRPSQPPPRGHEYHCPAAATHRSPGGGCRGGGAVMVTVANVAQRAGVSPATAARVLSGRGYASEDARRAVLAAAEEIGYVPNHIARSLRTRRTQLAGLLIGDVENSFYSVIAKNVESVAKDAGYHVVLCNSNDDPETEDQYLRLLDGMQVDGLIITPTGRNQRHLRRLLGKGTVIVQIDRMVEGLNADAVLLDNEAGAREAVSHLIAAGHS